MTITKLSMTINKHWRYNPSETSYHLNDEVAERFAHKKIEEGFEEEGRKYSYFEKYLISHIEVNEE